MKNNTIEINDINHVFGVDKNICVLNSGSIAVAYKIQFPEIFTLGATGFNNIMDVIEKSIYTYLPENVVIQFQYYYKKLSYDGENLKDDTFLQKKTKEHFLGRAYLEQTTYVFFILPNVVSYLKDFTGVILKKPTKDLTAKKLTDITNFVNQVEKTVNLLDSSNELTLFKAEEKELVGYFRDFLHFNTKTYSDLIRNTNNELYYGDTQIKIYSLCDNEALPVGDLSVCKKNIERSTDVSSFYRPINKFGLEFYSDHIMNIIICYDNQAHWKKRLESKITRLKGARFFDSQNVINADINETFLNDIIKEDIKFVRFHFNIIIWDKDKKNLQKKANYIESNFAEMGIKPYEPKKEIFYFLKWSLPGNGDQVPLNETVKTYGGFPFLFLYPEDNYKSDSKGFLFNDRLTQLPTYVDTFDKPYEEKLIDNRNFLVIAPSGGGKSFLQKGNLRQFVEEGNTKTVVVNIGGDDKIARLFKDDSLYLKYEEGKGLGVNPFYVYEDSIDLDKIEFLQDFIALLWKNGDDLSNDELSSLQKIIIDYYKAEPSKEAEGKKFSINNTRERNIQDFNKFLLENEKNYALKYRLISLDSLTLNLEKYCTGLYSNLFTTGEPIALENKKYIEFELDNIKDHKILFPIFGMLISDLTFNTMWRTDGDASKKKFFIDEAWKILEKPGMSNLLKYLYKTIRKFNGSVGIAVQQITDIVNESLAPDIASAILGNTGVKYLLNHSNVLYTVADLKKNLSLSDNMVAQLLSIRNNLSTKNNYPHTEFLLILGNQSKVYRLEACNEARVIYDSEKDQLAEFDKIYNQSNKDVENAITTFVEKHY